MQIIDDYHLSALRTFLILALTYGWAEEEEDLLVDTKVALVAATHDHTIQLVSHTTQALLCSRVRSVTGS